MILRPALLAAACLLPAAALADACAPVAAAYAKLGEVPAYRQVIAIAGQEDAETIAVGDTLYIRSGDGRETLPLPPGGRKQIMSQIVGNGQLTDCAPAGAESIDGVATTAHGYQPPKMGNFPMSRQTVWIGDADGLPRRMATDDGSTSVEISYEGVVAPM
ncbi:MAG: hypothetical protein WAT70_11105 [Rhizobiaceae bacterium]